MLKFWPKLVGVMTSSSTVNLLRRTASAPLLNLFRNQEEENVSPASDPEIPASFRQFLRFPPVTRTTERRRKERKPKNRSHPSRHKYLDGIYDHDELDQAKDHILNHLINPYEANSNHILLLAPMSVGKTKIAIDVINQIEKKTVVLAYTFSHADLNQLNSRHEETAPVHAVTIENLSDIVLPIRKKGQVKGLLVLDEAQFVRPEELRRFYSRCEIAGFHTLFLGIPLNLGKVAFPAIGEIQKYHGKPGHTILGLNGVCCCCQLKSPILSAQLSDKPTHRKYNTLGEKTQWVNCCIDCAEKHYPPCIVYHDILTDGHDNNHKASKDVKKEREDFLSLENDWNQCQNEEEEEPVEYPDPNVRLTARTGKLNLRIIPDYQIEPRTRSEELHLFRRRELQNEIRNILDIKTEYYWQEVPQGNRSSSGRPTDLDQ